MKRARFILFLCFGLLPLVLHAETKDFEKQKATESECDLKVAGRGCCSWHQGQCGCKGGRVVCCDGTMSPSCECLGEGAGVTLRQENEELVKSKI